MTQSTIGREAELGTIGRFVDAVNQGCGTLIVEGEPGIGKTTLWREGLRRAREHAYRVLTCRAGPGEAQMPFAALGDLFEPVDDAIGALPQPQAHGLAVALLKVEPDEGPPDPLTISVAGLGVLRHLACSGPVLIAIDNVHWIDAASYRVLAFALRRLVEEPVGVLLTRRPRDGHQDPFSLGAVLSGERVERLTVGPLSENDVGDLLRVRLGASFPRRVVARIHGLCRGNPFFALEVAMGVQRAANDGDPDEPDEDLRISSDLQALLLERVDGLPADSRRAVLIVASAAHATMSLLERIMGAAAARAGTDRCVELGILEVTGDRLRFSHPLIGSAVYAAALPGEKRAVHEWLATACSEPEESARHLALAASGPDASVADTVGRAATVVRDRGAPEVAAGLCELARRLTPAERLDDRSRRTIDAVDCLLLAGNFGRAQKVIHEALSAKPIGSDRASLLFRLGRCLPLPLAGPTFEEALAHANGDLRLVADIHDGLSDTHLRMGRLDDAAREAHEALRAADDLADDRLLMRALTSAARVDFYLGKDLQSELLGRALALERHVADPFVYLTPSTVMGRQLVWSGRLEQARHRLLEQRQRARDQGDEWAYARILEILVDLECRAGRFPTAAALADEEYEIASHIDEARLHGPLFARALAQAHLGHTDEARRDAEATLAGAEAAGNHIFMIRGHQVLGFVELSLGRTDDAARHLRQADSLTETMGCKDPSIFPFVPDAIEALVAVGDVDEAAAVLDRLESRAAALQRPWAVASVARCRALLLAARGDLDGAEDSVRASEAVMPQEHAFDVARTQLVLGTIQRRKKMKRLARDTLGRARQRCSELGAELWTLRCDVELDRIGGRAPSPIDLTPTERQIASLVAKGVTNREIATTLFMSVKTVESNLSRIYRKVGVRSRTELAHRLAEDRRS